MGGGVFENGVYRAGDVRIMDRAGDHRLPIDGDGFGRVAAYIYGYYREAVEAELARILATSPSVHDLVRENSCHMLMTGLFFGVPGYGARARTAGRGVVTTTCGSLPRGSTGDRCWRTFRLSLSSSRCRAAPTCPKTGVLAARLAKVACEELDQIDRQRYDCETPGGCLRYGVGFCGKDVAVACA